MDYKQPLSIALLLASLTVANAHDQKGYPLGWIYIPTASLDCKKNSIRCDIGPGLPDLGKMASQRVEVHSRPNIKSPVIATLKGGGPVYVTDNIPYKWDFVVLACPLVKNDDGTLSARATESDEDHWCQPKIYRHLE
jgi:hypothetical protein